MTSVANIEKKISNLSYEELAELRGWFISFDSDAWDAQIEADAKKGKLDFLAREALEEYKSGKAREI